MKNNPDLDPRLYQRGEQRNLNGRDRKARDLSLIKAERVALFHVQSAAGKASLFNTQIIPAPEKEPKPPIVIPDEFEEIVTTHPNRWQDTHGLFELAGRRKPKGDKL